MNFECMKQQISSKKTGWLALLHHTTTTTTMCD
jgi:hypothetical protein